MVIHRTSVSVQWCIDRLGNGEEERLVRELDVVVVAAGVAW
jgi:hypothetical protein